MAHEVLTGDLQPLDIARSAGVSTSTVRLYEDEGLLPPAQRTVGGHRRYGQHHLDAMLTARALRSGYSWTLARAVMRAAHCFDLDTVHDLINQRHAALHIKTGQVMQAIAMVQNPLTPPGTDDLLTRRVTIGRAAKAHGVTTATLRHWERMGVITPLRLTNGHRFYAPKDLRQLTLVQALRTANFDFTTIAQLTEHLGSNDPKNLMSVLETQLRRIRLEGRQATRATALLHHYMTTYVTCQPSDQA